MDHNGKVTLCLEAQGLKESLQLFVAAVDLPPILGLSVYSKINLVKLVELTLQALPPTEEIVERFSLGWAAWKARTILSLMTLFSLPFTLFEVCHTS